jgi:AcrR family transcriptional regulator
MSVSICQAIVFCANTAYLHGTMLFMATRALETDFSLLPGADAALASGLVAPSARGRMLEAVAQAVATKGYASMTVGDVVSRAGVSRKTFYEHFKDKEDCFLAACVYVGGALHDALERSLEPARTPYERIEMLVRNYLRALSASPRGAIAFIIEARAATPAVREHHRQILERFAELTRHPGAAAADEDADADRLFRLAGVIAVEDTAAYEIAQGRAERLLELEDTLVKLAARLTGVAETPAVEAA